MANANDMSPKLQAFKSAYDGSGGFNDAKTKKDQLNNGLLSLSTILNSAASDFASASNDTIGTQLRDNVSLAKSGVDAVRFNLDSAITSLLSDAKTVRDGIITVIENTQNTIRGLSLAAGATEDEERDFNNNVARLNTKIDELNTNGEGMLDAMAGAIGSVTFGVIGNMVNGGTLGVANGYQNNYQYVTLEPPVIEPPEPDPPEPDPPEPDPPENPTEDEDDGVPFLGEKIGGRYVNLVNDFGEDWHNIWDKRSQQGLLQWVSGVVLTAGEGVEFLLDGVIDTAAAAVDGVNSGFNWLFDFFNPRAGTTEEYWRTVGDGTEFKENWTTFGEFDGNVLRAAGNIVVGTGRTVFDAVQVAGNGIVTALDWCGNAIEDAADWVGDTVDSVLGFIGL